LKNFNLVIPSNIIDYGLMVVSQMMIGFVIGFIIALIFTAFQLAGEFFSFQMGFGITEVFDPLSQIEVPLVGQFQYLLAILVFLAINGHHLLITALYQSFEVIPIFNFSDVAKIQQLGISLTKLFSNTFMIALKIAFPIMATMLVVAFVLGLLAKASPQMNVFMVGFPLQIGIGLLTYLIVMPFLIEAIGKIINFIFDDILIKLFYIMK
jgi:flagellar biosynthetic protein FliR